MNKTVYADNAATTALSKTAFEVMLPYLTTNTGIRRQPIHSGTMQSTRSRTPVKKLRLPSVRSPRRYISQAAERKT